jgi:PAS domain S-box-containing protein
VVQREETRTGPPAELIAEAIRRAVDAAPDGIVIADDGGVIVFANAMACRLFGYGRDELVGAAVEVLLPDEFRAGHVAHRAAYTDRPRTRPMGSGLDLRGRRQNGEEFPVEISLSPVVTSDHVFVIAIIRDVTDRRRAAEELMAAHEELALVDDRERIARDLHDTVIQRLFAVGLSLQGALVRATDPAMVERVELAIDEIDGTIRDIRTAIFSLHARRTPTAGPRDDVIATVREASRALGFEPQVRFDGPVDAMMSRNVYEQLLPTLREVLSNMTKHAQATHAWVELVTDGASIILRASDDGSGIAEGTVSGGRGLGNIRERAEALGGSSDVRERPGGGTVVEWCVPLK